MKFAKNLPLFVIVIFIFGCVCPTKPTTDTDESVAKDASLDNLEEAALVGDTETIEELTPEVVEEASTESALVGDDAETMGELAPEVVEETAEVLTAETLEKASAQEALSETFEPEVVEKVEEVSAEAIDLPKTKRTHNSNSSLIDRYISGELNEDTNQ